MDNIKIKNKNEFVEKIHELSMIFGFDFESNGNDTFIVISGKKLKMEYSPKGFFYIEHNNHKICFNQMFTERLFGTSCLIEIYVTNGKDRTYCKFDQELRPAPSGSTLELPNFTYCEYASGKTHTFFANAHQLETIESDTLTNLMYDKIMHFENKELSNSNNQLNGNYTRFLFGVNSEMKNRYNPIVQLDLIRRKLGHSFTLFGSDSLINYSESINVYKYDPSITFYGIPYIDKDYSKTLKSESESVTGLSLSKKLSNRAVSIVRRKESVNCFNNTINYFNNNIVWPYISNYYLDLIDYVKNMQDGEVYQDPFKLSSYNK